MLCKCHACIVPVGSSKYNIYAVASLLEEKGWNLATGQSPPCLSICIGERHDQIVDSFEADLRAAVEFLGFRFRHDGSVSALSRPPGGFLTLFVVEFARGLLWGSDKVSGQHAVLQTLWGGSGLWVDADYTHCGIGRGRPKLRGYAYVSKAKILSAMPWTLFATQ